jgi:hypothetical protein
MKTHGSAVWQGGIKDGKGAISTKSATFRPRHPRYMTALPHLSHTRPSLPPIYYPAS